MLTEAEIRIKTAALRHFCPNGFTTSEDMDTYHCVSESTPSKGDVDAKVVELTAEYDAQEYARNRAAEYPSLLELTVALYDTDDKSAVEAKRAAVKLKYPKPE